MNISVLTPDKEIFYGTITSVKVPGSMGQFQVKRNHAPIVSSLEKGKVTLVAADDEHKIYNDVSGNIETVLNPGKSYSFNIEGGFIEVLNNEIALLVRGVKMN